jgi:hypothetical protein
MRCHGAGRCGGVSALSQRNQESESAARVGQLKGYRVSTRVNADYYARVRRCYALGVAAHEPAAHGNILLLRLYDTAESVP